MDGLNRLLDCGMRSRRDAVAIQTLHEGATFEHLELMSNGLAALMRDEWGVGGGDRIAVLAEKSIEIVISSIAAWKIGAIYAPIDVTSPPARTDGILKKLQPSLLIASESALATVTGLWPNIPRLTYERIRSERRRTERRPDIVINRDAPAIIMHTSGSTGLPKGVVLSHHSVLSYFESHNELVDHDVNSRSMNTGPFHFDVSIQDTMLPLYYGGSVIFHNDIYISSVFLNLLTMLHTTHLTAICSVLELISKDASRVRALGDSTLRVLVTGGEICDPKLFNLWLGAIPTLKVFNGYGPTECNSLCMAYELVRIEPDRLEPYPIGYPFSGMDAVLLDDKGQVIGDDEATGVLAMAGPQLMSEYWHDPDQTHQAIRFIGQKRFYITGDICHRDQSGCYNFVGRQDAEVKVRGRRINLNEVRNALLMHQQVRFACVSLRQYRHESSITAYVYADVREDFDLTALERIMYERLPPYMLPRHVCLSTTIPKESSAKVNEAAVIEVLDEMIRVDPPGRFVWAEDIYKRRTSTAADR